MKTILLCSLVLGFFFTTQNAHAKRWSKKKAWAWQAEHHWRVGCNYIPHTAINQLEMWQAATFDPKTIDQELGWAEGLGMTAIRVYLHDLLWKDPEGFKKRMDQFLGIANKHHIAVMFVIFDDCWSGDFKLGPQPRPKKGVHNSGWVQSPGVSKVLNSKEYPRLKAYVQGVVKAFGQDKRILAWDVYNEPGMSDSGDRSAQLLKLAFDWAREADPFQPLTSGVRWDADGTEVARIQKEKSDVISFHHYDTVETLREYIVKIKMLGRPLLCTEYMARPRKSLFKNDLPVFKREGISCFNWGFVAGKTNTMYGWGKQEAGEPKVWFHDILRPDGTPFSKAEVAVIRRYTRK